MPENMHFKREVFSQPTREKKNVRRFIKREQQLPLPFLSSQLMSHEKSTRAGAFSLDSIFILVYRSLLNQHLFH